MTTDQWLEQSNLKWIRFQLWIKTEELDKIYPVIPCTAGKKFEDKLDEVYPLASFEIRKEQKRLGYK